MNKINNIFFVFLTFFVTLTSLNANNLNKKDINSVLKESSLIKNKDYYKDMNKINKNFAIKINPEFLLVTGETKENFNKYAEEAAKDQYWVQANKAFYFETKDIKIKKINSKIPKYKKALKLFKKSVLKNNTLLSAYQGLNITVKYFTMITPDKNFRDQLIKNILKEYLYFFAKKLTDKGYCYGYFYKLKFEVDYMKDYENAVKTGDRGYDICKTQLSRKEIPKWLDKYFREKYVKAKTVLFLREEKIKKYKEKYGIK
jgi:hypothetical protein